MSNDTPAGSRDDGPHFESQPHLHSFLTVPGRLWRLERAHRQRLMLLAAATLLALALTWLPFAVVPAPRLALSGGLALAIALLALAIALSRRGWVRAAGWSCVLGALALYAAVLLFAPAGTGAAALPGFEAAQVPYVVFGALPVLVAMLALDPAVAVVGNGAVVGLNVWCVWGLPHDGAYDRLVAGMGGPLALTAGLALAQAALVALALAAASTMRRTLAAALAAPEGASTSTRGGTRERRLQEDIATLQQSLARIANGELAHVVLSATSELYPVATSLNLMAVRLTRLSRVESDLRQIEKGLGEASRVIDRISQGDLLTQPASTGTMVDGLLASLVQVQGHIATWLQGLSSGLQDARQENTEALGLAQELADATKQIEQIARQVPEVVPAAGGEVIMGAFHDAGELVRRLRAADVRLRYLGQAVQRIQSVQVGGVVGRLAPVEIPAPLDGVSREP